MIKTLKTALAVLCILTIALCAALIVQKLAGRARVDLTEQKLYTLSDGTQRIMASINQPVKLKLYYSRSAAMKGPEMIRFYNAYYLYVRDLLEEYVKLSGGRLRLEVIDPRRYSDEEEDAIAQGVKRFPLSEEEYFFFGLVAQTEHGREKALPFFEPQRQEFVEYDISKLIVSVTRRDKKRLGVLSSLDVAGPEMSPYMIQMMQMQGREVPRPWTVITHLRDAYEIETVSPEAGTLPDGLDFLLIIHPKDIPRKTLFAIDQFVMKGGRLAVFVDPYCLGDMPKDQQNPYAAMEQKKSSDLNVLLERWGVTMDPEEIVVDRALAVKTALQANARATEFPPYLSIGKDCFSASEVITRELNTVKVLFAGALRPAESSATVTPLITTTATGNTWRPSNPFELQFPRPEVIRKAVIDGTEPVMLGCRISGKLTTNFPDGFEEEGAAGAEEGNAKDAEKKAPRRIEAVREASPEAAVVVFSDVDMISDLLAYRESFFGVSQVDDNAPLLLNALDFLGGSGDLIAIRSRGGFTRPFEVVDRIEREAEKATAGEVEALNEKIRQYQERLAQLGTQAREGNEKLIAGTALAERKKIEEDIRAAQRELRRLNAARRADIEALGLRLQWHTMIWAPAAVLSIAIILAVYRAVRVRRYVARRAQA